MNERTSIRRALEPLHASPDTLEEVLDMIDREKAVKHMKKTGRNTMRGALIAAILVIALSVTAYAVGEYTGFFDTVFGDGALKSYEPQHVELTDNEGNVVKEYDTAGQERVPVDQEMAQRVLDGKVASSGASLTVGDYTCTVEDVTMADNGVGVMTYTIESEKGFPDLQVTDEGEGTFSLGGDPWLAAGDGESYVRDTPMAYPEGEGSMESFGLDVDCALVAREDTKLTVAAYMALFDKAELPETLDVYFFFGDKGDFSDEYKVTVKLAEPAETVKMTADGWIAKVSPMGLEITAPEGNPYGNNYVFGDIVIHMTDGSEYGVKLSESGTMNFRVSCIGEGVSRYVFNRLIDPDAVENITAVGDASGYQDENGEPVPYEEAWVEVEPELVGDTWTSGDALKEGLSEFRVDLDLTFTK